MTSYYYCWEGEDRKRSVKATMSKDPEIAQEAITLEPLRVSQGIRLSSGVPEVTL